MKTRLCSQMHPHMFNCLKNTAEDKDLSFQMKTRQVTDAAWLPASLVFRLSEHGCQIPHSSLW